MRERFIYMGLTEARGKIFHKGKVRIVIYPYKGLKRYWPFGCPGKNWERTVAGRNLYYNSNYM
jgi:hypothetical protein